MVETARQNPIRFNSFLNTSGAPQLAVAGPVPPYNTKFDPGSGNNIIVVPVGEVDKAVMNAVSYTKLLAGNIFAVHVLLNPSNRERIESLWKKHEPDIPLIVLESPDVSIVGPLRGYVNGIRISNERSTVTIVLPVLATSKWWHRFLFNRTARLIEKAFEGMTGVVTVRVPFSLANIEY